MQQITKQLIDKERDDHYLSKKHVTLFEIIFFRPLCQQVYKLLNTYSI